MRICYFGTYEKDYPRNKVMIQGLRSNGVEVVECHYPLWERDQDKTGAYLSFTNLVALFFRILFAYLYLCYRYFRIGRFDVLMVGYIGQMDLFLAKLLNLVRRRPVVFNPLVSLYDTLVLDRRIFRKTSLAAKLLFYLDKWSLYFSDIVILDTEAHIQYMAELFRVDRKKFRRVYVGADEGLFSPEPRVPGENGVFRVLFYGKFIPLHGIHHILKAAKALEGHQEIRFQVIGKGQLSGEIHALARRLELKNVDFVEWADYNNLPAVIKKADVCLGIFGDTPKASRVIPNKVFQCLAMGKPVLTSVSPASRELLTDEENVLFCGIPYEESISSSILRLKEESGLSRRLSMNAERLFDQELKAVNLTSGLIEVLKCSVMERPCQVGK